MTFYAEVESLLGRPTVNVFSPTEYRVTVPGWHVHNGASTSRPFGDGRSLEKACEALLRYCNRPASWVADGDECDHRCHAQYMHMEDKQAASRASLREVTERAAHTVAHWPAWKRGLPPCEDELCEREDQHEGSHRRAVVAYEEW